MWKSIKYLISSVCVAVIVTSCLQSEYTRLVNAELQKGTRQDSLLFGIRFGDTRQDFYGKCFDLNKQRLVTQGPGNASVQYLFTDSLVHNRPTQLRLLFFPDYDENDVITEMDMEFSYPGWAPWNKSLQSDSLQLKVIELLMNWYKGNEFVTAAVNDVQMPVKVDGNRRVLVYIKDTQSVGVSIQDILHPRFKHSSD